LAALAMPSTLAALTVPPALRRPLLACVLALAVALPLWRFAAAMRADAETALASARTTQQKTATRLAAARAEAAAREPLARRLADLRAALPTPMPPAADWERLADRLAADKRIAHITLHAQETPKEAAAKAQPPSIAIQHIYIEANLLHEEALLALDAIATDTPAHVVPVGCALRRDAEASPLTLRARCEYDFVAFAAEEGR
jgi:hypothetical protein